MPTLLLSLTLLTTMFSTSATWARDAKSTQFLETVCSQLLASQNKMPLLEPEDALSRLDSWELPAEVAEELKADLKDPAVTTRVAYLQGAPLRQFTDEFKLNLDSLDESLRQERINRGAKAAPIRRMIGAAAVLGVTTVAALNFDENWLLKGLGLVALAGTGRVAWDIYFGLGDATNTMLDALYRLGLHRILSQVTITGEAYSDNYSSAETSAWVKSSLVKTIVEGRSETVPVKRLNETIGYNRRWDWLGGLLPGRTKVIVTLHLMGKADNEQRLVLITRLKRSWAKISPRHSD